MGFPNHQILAIRYATVERRAGENFIAADVHDAPMPMDYFVWAIRAPDQDIVVDTGFTEAAALARKRRFLQCPVAALGKAGIDVGAVRQVLITHLHYDHAGNLARFPAATFHLQDSELAYATGRYMLHRPLRHSFDVEDVVAMVRNVHAERVVFHRGDGEIAPGVTVHHVGGHTAGLQVVRVHTARGWVVLASDASHFYANMRRRSPFPIVHDVGAMLEGYALLEALAEGPDHIIPGHDPAVLDLFPRAAGLDFDAVRLDLPPLMPTG